MDLDRLGEFAHGLRQRAELPEPTSGPSGRSRKTACSRKGGGHEMNTAPRGCRESSAI
jgi:hypothetical protein